MKDRTSPPGSPERVSLAKLTGQRTSTSPALTRILRGRVETKGPGRVAVASFQSSV